jgi:CubicO group peptidase (beta-lactamase class C family)
MPAVGLALVLWWACQSPSSKAPAWSPNPGDGWSVADAVEAGFDRFALDRLVDDIEAGRFPNTHAVLIEHDGRLVFEAYFSGSDERWGVLIADRSTDPESLHDVRSVSKSVTSLVLGVALAEVSDATMQLEARVNLPVADFLPELSALPASRSVTLHHLLTMTSGLAWNEMDVPYTDDTNDEIALYRTERPEEAVLARELVSEPGARWYYSGGDTQVLASVIHRMTGRSLTEVAREGLFEPLGIDRFEWLGPETWNPNPAAMSGLRLAPRDFAKIASLGLHGGRWNGRQVVPEAWIDLSFTRHVPEIRGDWSDDGTWGYAYQWWIGDLRTGERVVAGVGNGNQRLFILPRERLAVSILAGEYNKFEGHSERLLERILAARIEGNPAETSEAGG